MSRTAFILILLNAGAACAQSSANSTGVECVERLDIPKYPALADMARVTAAITTSVRLAADGTADRVNSDISLAKGKEVQDVFIKTVDESIRSSKFFAACGGRTLTFLFLFSLGDQIGTQRFSFSYPNRFTILAPVTVMNP